MTVPGNHSWLLSDPRRFGVVITIVIEVKPTAVIDQDDAAWSSAGVERALRARQGTSPPTTVVLPLSATLLAVDTGADGPRSSDVSVRRQPDRDASGLAEHRRDKFAGVSGLARDDERLPGEPMRGELIADRQPVDEEVRFLAAGDLRFAEGDRP